MTKYEISNLDSLPIVKRLFTMELRYYYFEERKRVYEVEIVSQGIREKKKLSIFDIICFYDKYEHINLYGTEYDLSEAIRANHFRAIRVAIPNISLITLKLLFKRITENEIMGLLEENDYELIYISASSGNQEIFSFLLNRLDEDKQYEAIEANAFAILDIATINGHIAILEEILQFLDERGDAEKQFLNLFYPVIRSANEEVFNYFFANDYLSSDQAEDMILENLDSLVDEALSNNFSFLEYLIKKSKYDCTISQVFKKQFEEKSVRLASRNVILPAIKYNKTTVIDRLFNECQLDINEFVKINQLIDYAALYNNIHFIKSVKGKVIEQDKKLLLSKETPEQVAIRAFKTNDFEVIILLADYADFKNKIFRLISCINFYQRADYSVDVKSLSANVMQFRAYMAKIFSNPDELNEVLLLLIGNTTVDWSVKALTYILSQIDPEQVAQNIGGIYRKFALQPNGLAHIKILDTYLDASERKKLLVDWGFDIYLEAHCRNDRQAIQYFNERFDHSDEINKVIKSHIHRILQRAPEHGYDFFIRYRRLYFNEDLLALLREDNYKALGYAILTGDSRVLDDINRLQKKEIKKALLAQNSTLFNAIASSGSLDLLKYCLEILTKKECIRAIRNNDYNSFYLATVKGNIKVIKLFQKHLKDRGNRLAIQVQDYRLFRAAILTRNLAIIYLFEEYLTPEQISQGLSSKHHQAVINLIKDNTTPRKIINYLMEYEEVLSYIVSHYADYTTRLVDFVEKKIIKLKDFLHRKAGMYMGDYIDFTDPNVLRFYCHILKFLIKYGGQEDIDEIEVDIEKQSWIEDSINLIVEVPEIQKFVRLENICEELTELADVSNNNYAYNTFSNLEVIVPLSNHQYANKRAYSMRMQARDDESAVRMLTIDEALTIRKLISHYTKREGLIIDLVDSFLKEMLQARKNFTIAEETRLEFLVNELVQMHISNKLEEKYPDYPSTELFSTFMKDITNLLTNGLKETNPLLITHIEQNIATTTNDFRKDLEKAYELKSTLMFYYGETKIGDTTAVMDKLVKDLVERYLKKPATVKFQDKEITLPLDYRDFLRLKAKYEPKYEANTTYGMLTKVQRDELQAYEQFCQNALKSYYQHTIHTAWRYLTFPNPWIDTSSPYVQHNANGCGVDLSKYRTRIALFYAAATDPNIPMFNNISLARRTKYFYSALAYLCRTHNWDETKLETKPDGSVVKVEYDNLERDAPGCFSGIPRHLIESSHGHPFTANLSISILDEEIRSAVLDYFKSKIIELTGNNKWSPKAIQTAYANYCLNLDETAETHKDILKQFNLPKTFKEDLETNLDSKYGTQFTKDGRFKKHYRGWFSAQSESEYYDIINFSTLCNIEFWLKSIKVNTRSSQFFQPSTSLKRDTDVKVEAKLEL